MDKWYKLDNAATIFPSVTSTVNTSVFRVSAILNEIVDPFILHKAVDAIYDRFPLLTVRLRKGVFWNYFDKNALKLIPQPESDYPCCPLDPALNNGHLIKILYYNARISVEVFHSLTDGTGAIDFLKSLLYYYLILKGKTIDHENKITLADQPVNPTELEDSFVVLFDPERYKQLKKEAKHVKVAKAKTAYRLNGDPFSVTGNKVIHLEMDASRLNAVAKEFGGTITTFLASRLLDAVYQTHIRLDKSKSPVMLTIPVNLRKHFKSVSMRNFFATVNIGLPMYPKKEDYEVICELNDQLKKRTDKDELEKNMCANVKIQHSTRLVPLFIKRLLLPVAFNIRGEDKKTMTLSNLGVIDLPKDMEAFVSKIEFVLYPSKKSPVNCSVISTNNLLNISFVLATDETELVRQFAIRLNECLPVEVYSNDWRGEILDP